MNKALTILKNFITNKENNISPINNVEKKVIDLLLSGKKLSQTYLSFSDNERLECLLQLFKISYKIVYEHGKLAFIVENSMDKTLSFGSKIKNPDQNYFVDINKKDDVFDDLLINFEKDFIKLDKNELSKILSMRKNLNFKTLEYLKSLLDIKVDSFATTPLTDNKIWSASWNKLLKHKNDKEKLINTLEELNNTLYNKFIEEGKEQNNYESFLSKSILNSNNNSENFYNFVLTGLILQQNKFFFFLLLNTMNKEFIINLFKRLDNQVLQYFFENLDKNYQVSIVKTIIIFCISKKIFLFDEILHILQQVIEMSIYSELKGIIFSSFLLNSFEQNKGDETKNKHTVYEILNIILDLKDLKFVDTLRTILGKTVIYEYIDNCLLELLGKEKENTKGISKRGLFFNLCSENTVLKIMESESINTDMDDIRSVQNQLLIYNEHHKNPHTEKLLITFGIPDVPLIEYFNLKTNENVLN